MSDPWPATRTSDWPTKRCGAELTEVRQCSKTRSVGRLTVPRCLSYVATFRPIKTSDYHTWHACRPLVSGQPTPSKNVKTPRLCVHEGRGADGGDADLTSTSARVGTRGLSRKVHWCKRAARPRFDVLSAAPGESSLRICSFVAGTASRTRANALPPSLAPGNISLGSARGYSEFNWRGVHHKHDLEFAARRRATPRGVLSSATRWV